MPRKRKYPLEEKKPKHFRKEKITNEIFMSDFVTAMSNITVNEIKKVPHYGVSDRWRLEWNNPVQVPDTTESPIKNTFKIINIKKRRKLSYSKKIEANSEDHYFKWYTDSRILYDLDDLDTNWLKLVHRKNLCKDVDYDTLELFITCFETLVLNSQLLKWLFFEKSIDETSICDICLRPESYEDNMIVFCDKCNLGVHQDCYGIENIPESSWFCDACVLNLRPYCIMCHQFGGPMKKVVNNPNSWIHMICAQWIPEVKLNYPIKLIEIDTSNVKQSRLKLVCCFCSKKNGCIQCSYAKCLVSFHITCAIQHNLQPKKCYQKKKKVLKIFCEKHQVKTPKKLENNILLHKKYISNDVIKSMVDLNQLKEYFSVSISSIKLLLEYYLKKRYLNNLVPFISPTAFIRFQELYSEEIYVKQLGKLLADLRIEFEKLRNICFLLVRREKLKQRLVALSLSIVHSVIANNVDIVCKHIFLLTFRANNNHIYIRSKT